MSESNTVHPGESFTKCPELVLHDHAENEESPSLSVTVKGIYTKRPKVNARSLPPDWGESDLAKNQFMCRRRVCTKPMNEGHGETRGNNFETANFVPDVGLAPFFWHNDQKKSEGTGTKMGYRAVLFQSVENYEALQNNPEYKGCFDDIDYMNSPSFGEQVIVQGCEVTQLAIGDVFAIEGGPSVSSLVVEITSPRKPCYVVNKRHGTPLGSKGIQRHCLTHALGGWFANVLEEGELRDGMKLVRIKHPNSKWTLSYTSAMLYGKASKIKYATCQPQWAGQKSELEELIQLPQLAGYEWKEEAVKLLKNWEDKDHKTTNESQSQTQSLQLLKNHGVTAFICAIQAFFLVCTEFRVGTIAIILGYFVSLQLKSPILR